MRTIDQDFDIAVSELTEWTPARTKIHIPKDNTEELVSLSEQYIEIFATQVQREMRGIKFGVRQMVTHSIRSLCIWRVIHTLWGTYTMATQEKMPNKR